MVEGTQRRLAAIVSTDVVGYSRLMGVDEVGTLAALRQHRAELIDPLIARHGGRIVKTMGDGLLLEFPSVVAAVECAVAMQTDLGRRNRDLDNDVAIRYRIGVHLGDVIVEGEDIFGDGVNIAARIEALAEPGGISITDDAHRQVRDKIDLEWRDSASHEIKNIARPVQVWHWSNDPASSSLAISAPSVEPSEPDSPSVAVLPFANLSSDPEQSYFADGMTDDLITHLSKLSGLFVIARNSAFAYKDRNVNIQEIAQDLGVRYVLEGSVRRAGNTLRINAQLIDGDTGGHVWAEIFDRELKDVFAVQDEVTGEIVAALKVTLAPDERSRPSKPPTENLQAYDFFLKARELYFGHQKETLAEAVALYRKATDLDPNFAAAFAGEAAACAFGARFNMYEFKTPAEAHQQARAAIDKALLIEPENAEALGVRALIYSILESHENAISTARQAVAAEPNNAPALRILAETLMASGKIEEALREVETALRIDPKPDSHDSNLTGEAYFLNRQPERALPYFADVLERDPEYWEAYNGVITANAELGRIAEAQQAVNTRLKLWPAFNVQATALHRSHWNRDVYDYWVGALRKGGAPEWPYDFKGDETNRLSGTAISELLLGHRLEGTSQTERMPFSLDTSPQGLWTFKNEKIEFSGQGWVEDELWCFTADVGVPGRIERAVHYRNPGGTREGRDEFVWSGAYDIFRYSVVD